MPGRAQNHHGGESKQSAEPCVVGAEETATAQAVQKENYNALNQEIAGLRGILQQEKAAAALRYNSKWEIL